MTVFGLCRLAWQTLWRRIEVQLKQDGTWIVLVDS